MSYLGKILGGGIGWALGGALGSLIGIAIGEYVVDSPSRQARKKGRQGGGQASGFQQNHHHTQAGDFGAALLALSAAVIKADGKVLKVEIKFVRQFFTNNFGTQRSNDYIKLLKEILKQDIQLRPICIQIRSNMQHALRLELVRYLFELSNSDGEVHTKEIEVIKKISFYLGVSERDFISLKNMYYEDTDSSYKILGISKSATNDEIKKAYRKMALKYHPDRLSDLGPELQENAKEKFQKVQDAYEKIKKERKIK